MSDQKQKDNGTASSSMASLARYLGLAFLIPVGAGGGWIVGSFLDKSLRTGYWTVTCLILGVVGGFIQLLRELLRDADKQ
jgi:F0F1-type ATP synthase assembly protein I